MCFISFYFKIGFHTAELETKLFVIQHLYKSKAKYEKSLILNNLPRQGHVEYVHQFLSILSVQYMYNLSSTHNDI